MGDGDDDEEEEGEVSSTVVTFDRQSCIFAIACCSAHFWVAVKELKLSYYIGGTLLFTIYTHYGNLI